LRHNGNIKGRLAPAGHFLRTAGAGIEYEVKFPREVLEIERNLAMPHARALLPDRRATRSSSPIAVALGAALLAGTAMPAAARQNFDMRDLDLDVRPGDFAAPKRPPFVTPAPAPAPDSAGSGTPVLPEVFDEVDRVERRDIPNGPRGTPLGSQAGDGFLEELIEGKTIPLFRVTVQPPF
jgi:hypothetical protein